MMRRSFQGGDTDEETDGGPSIRLRGHIQLEREGSASSRANRICQTRAELFIQHSPACSEAA
jgi:hypothetical protein